MSESIFIKGLEVEAHIGVPDEERRDAQKLKLDIRFKVDADFAEMRDDISATIDYAEVASAVEKLVAARPRCLIETLAVEVREMIRVVFQANEVWVRVEKKILPNAEWVSVETEWMSVPF